VQPAIVLSPSGHILEVNQSCANLLGYRSETLRSRRLAHLLSMPAPPFFWTSRQSRTVSLHLRAIDGRDVPLRADTLRVRSEGRQVVIVLGHDAMPDRPAAASLAAEAHHRIKNDLQIIASLLRRQSRRLRTPDGQRLLRDNECRVHAIGIVHELLCESACATTVDLSRYLPRLVRVIIGTKETAAEVTVRVQVPTSRIPPGHAVTCGLIVHELVANSFHHAFVGRTTGRVEVRGVVHDREIALSVGDDGVGLPSDFYDRCTSSHGSALVRGLVEKQLRGTVDRASGAGGTVVSFRFPRATTPAGDP